jgi:uncharacterized DUF497 family protein
LLLQYNMKIEFDPQKSKKNEENRGLPFDLTADFEWETAVYTEDLRHDYSEQRFVAMGYLDERVHIICFTPIEDGVRIISFRKANIREIKHYEAEKESINK